MISMNENNFYLSQRLAAALSEHQSSLAVAESCTGGGLAYQLTDNPDCSTWFERGFVTYSNAAKIELLEVNPLTLERYGAVSSEVALEMAKGAIKNSHADIAMSITGIAGPGGGSAAKPVGLVYFGLADGHGFSESRLTHLKSGRHQIREDSIAFAIHWLLAFLDSKKFNRRK